MQYHKNTGNVQGFSGEKGKGKRTGEKKTYTHSNM